MKTKLMRIMAMIGLAMALTAAASAQTAQRYRAEIGFGFSIGGQQFAAGDYIIEQANPSSGLAGLKITSVETGKSRIFSAMVESGDESESPKRLVFNRYGEQFFLRSVETPTMTARIGQRRGEIRASRNMNATRVTVALGNAAR